MEPEIRLKLRKRAEEILNKMSNSEQSLKGRNIQEALEELNINKIELELQNEELQRSQVQLAESRNRYFELFDMAPFGYYIYTKEYKILEANLTGANLLNSSKSDLIGSLFNSFIYPIDQDKFHFHINNLKITGKKQY